MQTRYFSLTIFSTLVTCLRTREHHQRRRNHIQWGLVQRESGTEFHARRLCKTHGWLWGLLLQGTTKFPKLKKNRENHPYMRCDFWELATLPPACLYQVSTAVSSLRVHIPLCSFNPSAKRKCPHPWMRGLPHESSPGGDLLMVRYDETHGPKCSSFWCPPKLDSQAAPTTCH